MSGEPIREALKGASASIAREVASAEGEQIALFDLPCDDPTGAVQAARDKGRGGRPKGAQNLSTRQLREYLLARMEGRTPQERLAQWAVLGPIGLKKALGIEDGGEAFSLYLKLETELGRYFMAPMTPVDGEGNPTPVFNVVIGGNAGVMAASGEVEPPWTYLKQNQALIEGDDALSKAEGESK